ncbi:MAG: GNAT family N-acetyltransferase [Oscillospiraceae bacterium]|jgi:predicted GNAT family N-acyltransferase|nr:GNAT family N-acetyltransferase [Oscillospiraceae bacterium]
MSYNKKYNLDAQYFFGELEQERLYETLMLFRDVFMEFDSPDYTAEGIDEFLKFLEPLNITEMLDESKMRIWTCCCNGCVVGALAAEKNHINLLFVDGMHHRKGIARRLLEIMINSYNPKVISVNSSPYAVKAYQKLGFNETAAEQFENGIRFIPMKKNF